MFDPVGTKEKHGFDHATSQAFDIFQPVNQMYMMTVKVNGSEVTWVIENLRRWRLTASRRSGGTRAATSSSRPITTCQRIWGESDDPYELLLGKKNVIPNE
jgi:hypothetical protein